MKKIIFILAISTIIISACGNKKNKKNETHVHEEGKECSNSHKMEQNAHHQETFVVEADSTKNCGNSCAGCKHATSTCKTEEGHSHDSTKTEKAHSHEHGSDDHSHEH